MIKVLLFILVLGFFLASIISRTDNWIITTEAEISSNLARPLKSPFAFDYTQLYFGDRNGFIYAVNKQTGKINWRFKTQNYTPYPINTEDQKFIFIADFDARIYAIDKKTGLEAWRYKIPNLIQPDTEVFVSKNLLLIGGRDGNLYALEKKTGNQKWVLQLVKRDLKMFVKNTTVIHFGLLQSDNDSLFVNAADGIIYRIDITSGGIRWKYTYSSYMNEEVTLDHDLVYLRKDEFHIVALNKDTGEVRWVVTMTEQSSFPLVVHNQVVLAHTKQGHMYVYNRETGNLMWKYSTNDFIQTTPRIFNNSIVVSVYKEALHSQVIAFDVQGNKLWTYDFLGDTADLVPLDERLIAMGESGIVHFIEKDGSCTHQLKLRGSVIKKPVVAEGNLFIYTTDYSRAENLFNINGKNGALIWGVQDVDIDYSTLTFNDNSLYMLNSTRTQLFTLVKSTEFSPKYFYKVQTHSGQKQFNFSHYISTKVSPLVNFIEKINKKITSFKLISDLEVRESGKVKKNNVYELSLFHNESQGVNLWDEVTVKAVFKDKYGHQYIVSGFYYDQHMWKVRFVPPSAGEWSWEVDFMTDNLNLKRRGTVQVLDARELGFIKINPNNHNRFIYEGGKPFFPIGFEDTVIDRDYNGIPIDQWTGLTNLPIDSDTVELVNMDTYFDNYNPQGKGFNFFRWGVDNGSFSLWKTITPQGNDYKMNEGVWGDELMMSVRHHGYRVLMSIFGFHPPFPYESSNKENLDAIKKYVKYIVARYGAYVDMWELMNEATVEDRWINEIAGYLRSIDPYQHPITTNWERADMKNIDINSLHWYGSESPSMVDKITQNKVIIGQKWGKPVIFSEVGNKVINWDKYSSLRFRVKNWLTFFSEAGIVWWNTSSGLYRNKDNANIYIGKDELLSVINLQKFIENLDGNLKQMEFDSLISSIRSYGLYSDNFLIGYFYHYKDQSEKVRVIFNYDFKKNGKLIWIDPKTGVVLSTSTIEKGKQEITGPFFSEDVLIKVEYNSNI